MILKRRFNPLKVLRYVRAEMAYSVALSAGVYALYAHGWTTLSIPFSIAAILGSALAIFIAFRNNTSYSRWWEARTLWGTLQSSSRSFARQIIANANTALQIGKSTPERVEVYKREMITRHVAFAHALRLHLRGETAWEEFRHLLDTSEFKRLLGANNIPNLILLRQGERIKEGMREEILGAFDNISLEPTLGGLNALQASCERIKNTPLLRQYDYFTRLFLLAFIALLPFSLVGDLSKLGIGAMTPPIAALIAFVFAIISKVGEVNENPFEGEITDVPMTALCREIERDLREMLGEKELPPALQADENGYLM
jgi:putative membrane protein